MEIVSHLTALSYPFLLQGEISHDYIFVFLLKNKNWSKGKEEMVMNPRTFISHVPFQFKKKEKIKCSWFPPGLLQAADMALSSLFLF